MTARHKLVGRGGGAGGQVAVGVTLAVAVVWAGLGEAVAVREAARAGPAPCLPQRQVDLVKLIAEQALIPPGSAAKFVAVSRGSPRWMAGFNLAVAWENEDCPAFADFAQKMGYQAFEVIDPSTGEHHYVVLEKAGRQNGLFVFRSPAERQKARPLTITAPAVSLSRPDDRAIRLYRDVKALVYLQNTAPRCSSQACSSCSAVENYACGGCARTSDAAHSVDHLLFAVYAGLGAVRKDLAMEYDGDGEKTALPGCRGSAQLSQGSAVTLVPQQDDATYPGRFWRALERRLGPQCVCYPQRESGCRRPDSTSVFGRMTNQEPTETFDPCGQPSTRLSYRFVHLEASQLAVEDIAAALVAAVPLPH